MNKTIKTTTPFNMTLITSTLAIASFIGMVLLWIYVISFSQYVNGRNLVNEEQIGKLSIQSAEQEYCNQNAISPCTKDAIYKHD